MTFNDIYVKLKQGEIIFKLYYCHGVEHIFLGRLKYPSDIYKIRIA